MRALFTVLLLAGCSHSAVLVGNAQPVVASSAVHASQGVAAALVIGTAAIAASSATASPSWMSEPVPAMLAEREVSQQDCTQPIDLTAGNLRCR